MASNASQTTLHHLEPLHFSEPGATISSISTTSNNHPYLFHADDHQQQEEDADQHQQHQHQQNVSALAPADSGRDAWLFLASSFMLEALIWGFALSFGVMQEYYSSHPPFEGQAGSIASVGTTASGVMYFTAPIWFGVIALWPATRRWMIYSGPFIIAASLIGSSFATSVGQLIATQGLLYGLGGSIIYIPTLSLLDEWFVRRKGLAFGIMWAGTGTAGVVMPLVLNAALNRFGHAIVLRAAASITFLLMLPFLPFIKPRLPAPRSRRSRRVDLSFLASPHFLAIELANTVQALGYFIPSIYLPTYAAQLGAGQTTSALTLVVVNVASVAGSVLVGGLTDRLHPATVGGGVAVAAAAAVLVFWGLSSNLALLFTFCAAYGLSAGGFSSAWPGMVGVIVRHTARPVDLGLVMGFLGAGRGLGNVISGPISEKLLGAGVGAAGTAASSSSTGYAGEFGPLIIFTGVTAFCSGLTVLVR